jgi:hypothetical protein
LRANVVITTQAGCAGPIDISAVNGSGGTRRSAQRQQQSAKNYQGGTNKAETGLRDWQLQRPQIAGGASTGVPRVITQASREASHDRDGATGQADDVVSDGADQMAGETPCLQPLKPGPLGSGKKCSFPDPLPAHPLAVPGQVLQVLRLRMHDVALDRPGSKNGLLRAGWKSAPEPVFGLVCLVSSSSSWSGGVPPPWALRHTRRA